MTAYESIALNAADAAHDSGHRFDAARRWAATLDLAFDAVSGMPTNPHAKAKPAAATCTCCTRPAAWLAAMP